MNTLLHREQQQDQIPDSSPYRQDPPAAPEITLGTPTILAIFFALAVLCAVFFGLGYTLGVKRPAIAPVVAAAPAPAPNFSAFKPAPGSPLPTAKPTETVTVPLAPTALNPDSLVVGDPFPRRPTPASISAATTPAQASPVSPALLAPSIVQVAAVSHQEDADLIASTLKRRGYAVVIRHEPQDTLLHLQIGPFPTKKDAEAMRQRLQADGFNAYIK